MAFLYVPAVSGAVMLTAETDLNLPLTGLAMVLVTLFLKVKAPQGSFRGKILALDWMCVSSAYIKFEVV